MKEDNKIIMLEERDVKKRLNELKKIVKSEGLGIEITWNTFIESIDQQTKAKIKGNYLIPYARYLEDKLRDLATKLSGLYTKMSFYRREKRVKSTPRIYERIDDKVDTNYIRDLERRVHDFYNKIQLSNVEIFKLKIVLSKEISSRKKSQKRYFRSMRNVIARLEFIVNDFLTLKLENNKTFIYIKGKKFIQCIRLFLQIPPQESYLYEEIESIDEAAEVFKQSLLENRIVEGPMARPSRFQNKTITPEQEFWGHCSNIQAWAEHDYDTRLIHSNLVFQLLKQLTFVGDPKAKAIFKEEIAIRFESGYHSVVAYLLEQGYLIFIDKDQLKTLLENNVDMEDQFLENKHVLASYGTLFIKIASYPKAIKMLNKSLYIAPKYTRALFLIGITYGILGDYGKAFQSFSQILQNFKSTDIREKMINSFIINYFELAWYGFVLSKERLNEYGELFKLYTSLLKTPKKRVHIHETIIDVLKRLAKKYPVILLALIENGYMRYLNEVELKSFLENVKNLPPPQLDNEFSLTNYGFVNIIIGDFTKAKYVLKDLLYKIDLKNPILPQCLLGIAYGSLNQHEKAMQSFRKVLDINDKYDIAWFGLGLSYTRSERYIKLLKLFLPKQSLIYSKSLNYKIYKNKSDRYKKWYEKTINALESFIQMNPSNAVALRDLVAIYQNSWIRNHGSTKLQFAINSVLTEHSLNPQEEESNLKLNCKFCGNKLLKEQKICPVCGKMVI